jgi:hypothetical protein
MKLSKREPQAVPTRSPAERVRDVRPVALVVYGRHAHDRNGDRALLRRVGGLAFVVAEAVVGGGAVGIANAIPVLTLVARAGDGSRRVEG